MPDNTSTSVMSEGAMSVFDRVSERLMRAKVLSFDEAMQSGFGARQEGLVYFVSYGPDAPIKIGFTTNFAERKRQIQNACPFDIQVLATVEASNHDERAYHRRFHEHRLRGEWFEPHPDILAEITRLTNPQAARGKDVE